MSKSEIIAQIAVLLAELVSSENSNTVESVQVNNATPITAPAPIEMLTVKECTEAVSGLSEHTVRLLVAQKKIPFIRTGQGKRGKILINKAALLDYLEITA